MTMSSANSQKLAEVTDALGITSTRLAFHVDPPSTRSLTMHVGEMRTLKMGCESWTGGVQTVFARTTARAASRAATHRLGEVVQVHRVEVEQVVAAEPPQSRHAQAVTAGAGAGQFAERVSIG